MAAGDELKRLLEKAGVIPFRWVGKVRAAHDPRTPAETLAAAVESIRKFAGSCVNVWGEPSGVILSQWESDLGLAIADVCDDPQPPTFSLKTQSADWFLEWCHRYHFTLVPSPSGIDFRAVDGWSLKVIVPLLPNWFVQACKSRRADLVAHVATLATVSEPTPPPRESSPREERTQDSPSDKEDESCYLCQRKVSQEDRGVLKHDILLCQEYGARAIKTKAGTILSPKMVRCPYKAAA